LETTKFLLETVKKKKAVGDEKAPTREKRSDLERVTIPKGGNDDVLSHGGRRGREERTRGEINTDD